MSTSRTLVAGAVFVIVAVATVGIWRNGDRRDIGDAEPATFIGSEACRDCHQDKWDSFLASGHSHTLWTAADFPQRDRFDEVEFNDPERGHTYRYRLTDNGIDVSLSGRDDTFPLQYAFGSGDHAVTFMSLLSDSDGELFGVEHRATWFAHNEELGVTPGHLGRGVNAAMDEFGRTIKGDMLHRCFDCHSTVCDIRDDGSLNVSAPNVGCESCHGPGSAHASAANDGPGLLDFHAGLGREVEITLCARCHRSITELPDDSITTNNRSLVRFQPVGLVRSRCFTETDSLTCSTCHDPHEHATERSRAEYEQRCVNCHAPQSEQSSCPVSPETNCMECHMPAVGVLPGVAFHDHWIRIRDESDPSGDAPLREVVSIRAAGKTPEHKLAAIRFDDVTESVGLEFKHDSPLTEERHLHLVMGSGVAWLDFDVDGWPDLYCGQGRPFGESDAPPQADRLFQNVSGTQFIDVTDSTGLHDLDYTMGLAIGDFDNDGFPDLFVSHYGRSRLYHNNGDGTFSDATDTLSETDDERFGASSTWVDLNEDGSLDLFATAYLKLTSDDYRLCHETYEGRKHYVTCHPRYLPALQDAVLVSGGDGTFRDDSIPTGLNSAEPHQGLGVAVADFDRNGHIDVYVANDSVMNQLWMNAGDAVLSEQGLLSGTAMNRAGRREAGMGVAVGDIDGDGEFDLFVTNYFGETNTLYRNEGASLFTDVTDEFGLAAPSRARLGFGVSLFDADADGWPDLFVANGHVHDRLKELGRDEPFAQLPQVYANQQGRRMSDVSATAGDYFHSAVVGRGSAVGDFNRDLRPDLAVLHLHGPATLLKNDSESGNVLALELVGTQCNRSAIGAVVEIETDSRRLVRLQRGSTSYLSCDGHRILIGLGATTVAKSVIVHWPGGAHETWENLRTGETHFLIEGRSPEAVRTVN